MSNFYVRCPACDSEFFEMTERGVFFCDLCGAEFGYVSRKKFYEIVRPEWSKYESISEVGHYFDFIVYDDGNIRHHGWIDPDGLLMQVG